MFVVYRSITDPEQYVCSGLSPDLVMVVFMDDKHLIHVGEPGDPVQTGAKDHGAVLCVDGVAPLALDHDQNIKFKVVTSVLQACE